MRWALLGLGSLILLSGCVGHCPFRTVAEWNEPGLMERVEDQQPPANRRQPIVGLPLEDPELANRWGNYSLFGVTWDYPDLPRCEQRLFRGDDTRELFEYGYRLYPADQDNHVRALLPKNTTHEEAKRGFEAFARQVFDLRDASLEALASRFLATKQTIRDFSDPNEPVQCLRYDLVTREPLALDDFVADLRGRTGPGVESSEKVGDVDLTWGDFSLTFQLPWARFTFEVEGRYPILEIDSRGYARFYQDGQSKISPDQLRADLQGVWDRLQLGTDPAETATYYQTDACKDPHRQ